MATKSLSLPLLVLTATMVFPSSGAAEEPSGQQRIVEQLMIYAGSLDRQETETASKILHDESRQFAVTPNGLLAINKETYLDLLEQKKIGGVDSRPSVQGVRISGTAASATVLRPVTDLGALFTHYAQLLWVDSTWQIMSVTTSITSTKK